MQQYISYPFGGTFWRMYISHFLHVKDHCCKHLIESFSTAARCSPLRQYHHISTPAVLEYIYLLGYQKQDITPTDKASLYRDRAYAVAYCRMSHIIMCHTYLFSSSLFSSLIHCSIILHNSSIQRKLSCTFHV